MSLYYEAAAILANTDNIGGSLKSRIYNKKDLKSTPGQLFALIAETSKWSIVLKDLTPILALLLTHDLLLAKNGVAAAAGHVLKLAITRHKARLSAELTKARIRYGYATVDAFRAAVNDGELEKEEGDAPKSKHPRWVRVNTIKTTLEEQLSKTFAGFVKTENLADVLSAPKKSKIYYQDPNIPNLLALPSRIDLSRSFAYTKGQIIFQDKASCFPAYLLDPKPDDGDVIDATAAPGNKTTHLAAIVSDRKQPGEEQKVIAFERDKGRTFTLQKMVKLASADGIVQVKGSSDFIAAKPGSDEFSNVAAILLDPSCSGTGIVGRDDAIKMHLPAGPGEPTAVPKPDKGKKRKRGEEADNDKAPSTLDLDMDDSTPEETPMHGKLAERLAALSSFQLHILTHAMRFESAHKITYSTCSIHFEENEGVVFKALASSIAKERGWKILKRESQVAGLKQWHRRGVWEDEKLDNEPDESFKKEVLEACIRCDKGTEEGTMGFFVAAFVREGNSDPAQITEGVLNEDDEWNGFSDDEVVEEADHVERKCKQSLRIYFGSVHDMAYAGESSVSSPLTSSTTRTHTTTATPPINPDLSRARLKKIAKWIRDELDLLVAREGPDILRSDDVVTLHETFIALRHTQNITVSDLRATGIHKAVQDLAGVATRWPGRLCDDCDRIIDIWTAKFGSFSDIHPFLYGRGGRLEGISSIHEHSRESLLKRWARTCPDKIHPKRSHRLGDLGFTAGSWWINPLFAHHAGIIGLEACEGGTTYDKHGAYALLLKDTGEIEASSEDRFTYRVPQNDKGKFRLTSATPKSRDPVRVLRSHSINSVWGPKAGVRYDGLYSVKGWSIKQAKSTDLSGGHWKEGDIVFDVRFERRDSVPMEVVTKRPTATEVDDYQEYKRLRRASRDIRQKQISAPPIRTDFEATAKAGPPIVPSPPVSPNLILTQADPVPSTPRRGIFKHLHFNDEAHTHPPNREQVVSPKTIPPADPALMATTTTTTIPKNATLAVPAPPKRTSTIIVTTANHTKPDNTTSTSPNDPSPANSNTSSAHTASNTIPDIKIREVAPWIDYDAALTMPSPTLEPPVIHHKEPAITHSSATFSLKTGRSGKARSRERFLGPVAGDGGSGSRIGFGGGGVESRSLLADSLAPTMAGRLGKRRSVLGRSRNPMAKLFDGGVDDDQSDGRHDEWEGAEKNVWRKHLRLRGGDDLEERDTAPPPVYAPTPIRPFSPDIPFIMTRRDAIRPPPANFDDVDDDNEDPFIQTPAAPTPHRLLGTPAMTMMKDFISRPETAAPLGSPICSSTTTDVFGEEEWGGDVGVGVGVVGRLAEDGNKKGDEGLSLAEQRLKSMIL
ncbi:hypothetical protein PTNB73_05392 [Pyrenophora teres f. teres]|nr:hypothetical protein PTNB73_05392 [Pyrenophora teres f. teres]